MTADDLKRVLSRPADEKKLARVDELMWHQEEISRAKKIFDEKDR